MKSYWTIFSSIATLCALCLSTVVVYTLIFSPEALDFQEFMAQEKVGEDTNAELRVRLFEAKTKLENAQKEIRELKLKLNESQDLLKAHELKIAGIISGEKSGVKINDTLLKELMTFRKESGMTSQQFEEMYRFVLNSYKLLKADQTVEETFKAKAALIRERLASTLTAGSSKNSKKGMVLDINPKLDVIAINLGYGDGVTQGSEWQVTEDNKFVASLKIVEVRKSLSLGILTKGKLQDVLQGATVERNVKD